MEVLHRAQQRTPEEDLLEEKLEVGPSRSHRARPPVPIPTQINLESFNSLRLIHEVAINSRKSKLSSAVTDESSGIRVREMYPSRTEQKVAEHKTIVVSNRLPLKLSNQGGKIRSVPSTGGLATGMKSVHEDGNGLWIGWSGIAEEELDVVGEEAVEDILEEQNCAGVSLTREEVEKFYLGFSNNALWPLFHYFLEYARYDENEWEVYKRVNYKFADVVCANLEDGDSVWIHDYQLLLLPELIRERCPNVSIGFFLHIPFPSWEVLR